MASKEMGTDQMFVLPTAEIAILGAAPAVDILYRKEIEQADDTGAFRQSKMREYRDTFCTPYHSASGMLVGAVIEPSAARARIIDALLMLETKLWRTGRPQKMKIFLYDRREMNNLFEKGN